MTTSDDLVDRLAAVAEKPVDPRFNVVWKGEGTRCEGPKTPVDPGGETEIDVGVQVRSREPGTGAGK